MRFSYDPENNELSVYVKKNEFDLAANETEYKVFKRVFNRENLESFLKAYSNFIKDIFDYITPNEKIQDIVAISTYKQLYSWRSLSGTELTYGDESSSFLENMMIYGLSVMDRKCIQNGGKNIMEEITPRDKSKLSLIMTLIDTLNLPTPYVEGKKSKNTLKSLQKKLNTMDAKLKVYEEKYKFSSEDAWKYYNDDKLPDEKMLDWLEIYEEKQYILSIDKKRQLAEELASKWLRDIE